MNIFNQFDNVQIDWGSIIKKALLPFERDIAGLIESQQHTGEDGYGVDFNYGKKFTQSRHGGYSSPYARVRIKEGHQFIVKDFHRNGEFHKAIKVLFFDDRCELHSTDKKSVYIEQVYGEKIFKLQNKNINALLNSGVKNAIIRGTRERVLRTG